MNCEIHGAPSCRFCNALEREQNRSLGRCVFAIVCTVVTLAIVAVSA